jgi:hypothetical protein
VYRIYTQCYSPETIVPVVESQGFEVVELTGGLAGQPYNHESAAVGIVARKTSG